MSRTVLSIAVVAGLLALAGCESSQPRDRDAGRDDAGYSQAADKLHGEVGCAMCIYHMPGVSRCVLAAKIGEKTYLVDGVKMDQLGDPHDPASGLCKVSREATIRGRIEGDRLVASEITPEP